MRVVFILISVAALWSVSAAAQSAISKKDSKIAAKLTQLEKDIGQANIRRDKAFFERIEADEFIFTDAIGGVTTKAEDIASLDKPAGEIKLVSYEVDGVHVRVYAKTAVVTGRATTVSKGKEREITSRTRFTDVFVRRSGRWQIVVGHSSRIREPQK